MNKEFEVTWEGDLPGSPEQVWAAITVHSAGWQWHVDYEPRVGGAERGLTAGGGKVTAWDPPRHFATASDAWCEGDGGFNELDIRLDGRDGATYVRYTHRTAVPEDEYDVQLDACRRHTVFYLHSLGEYVRHFAGQDPVYVSGDAPAAPSGDGIGTVRRALGLPEGVAAGDRVTLRPEGLDPIEGVVDYATDVFLGVRTTDALYRFYGRDEWGWPVGFAHHLFAAATDRDVDRRAWTTWLDNAMTRDEVVA